jgi:hypothetical protein
MKQWPLLIALAAFIAPAVQAQTYPNFTQGSMTSTTVTDTLITETIVTERYGGNYTSYTGTNVTPDGPINDPATSYTVNTPGEDYQMEIVERIAGLIELETITRTIDQTSTKNSLSIFSQ